MELYNINFMYDYESGVYHFCTIIKLACTYLQIFRPKNGLKGLKHSITNGTLW